MRLVIKRLINNENHIGRDAEPGVCQANLGSFPWSTSLPPRSEAATNMKVIGSRNEPKRSRIEGLGGCPASTATCCSFEDLASKSSDGTERHVASIQDGGGLHE